MTPNTDSRKRPAHAGFALNIGEWLALAAAPTFASMAWLSALDAHGMAICATASSFSPVNNMALMYLVMGIFHLSPWLKLASARSRRLDPATKLKEGE